MPPLISRLSYIVYLYTLSICWACSVHMVTRVICGYWCAFCMAKSVVPPTFSRWLHRWPRSASGDPYRVHVQRLRDHDQLHPGLNYGFKWGTVVAATNYKTGDTKRRTDWIDYEMEAICNRTTLNHRILSSNRLDPKLWSAIRKHRMAAGNCSSQFGWCDTKWHPR